MRRVFHLFLIVVAVAFFSACFGSNGNVLVLHIETTDGSIPPQFYSETDLMVSPIYEDRTLSLEYTRVYPDRTEETLDADVDTGGIVGGENFDRFEEIVELIKGFDYEGKDEGTIGGSTLIVDLEFVNGEHRRFEIDWNNESEGLEEIRSFYLDLSNMLTEEVPV